MRVRANAIIYIGLGIISILLTIMSYYLNENLLLIGMLCILLALISIYLLIRENILLFLAVFSSFFLMFFNENLNFSHYVIYILDYFIVLIAIRLFHLILTKKIKFNLLIGLMISFILFAFVGFLINGSSILSYIKVIYFDYVRYFIVCLAAMNFSYNDKKIITMFKGLGIFILVQIPIILIQLSELKKNYRGGYVIQDYASGLLGGKSTAELGGIICIIFVVLFILYINNKINKKTLAFNIIALFGISILSEIKFVLFIIPILLCIIAIYKMNIKISITIISSIAFIFLGMNIITKINPGFENFFTKENIESYMNYSYGGSGLSRVNSIQIANSNINYDINKIFAGNGVGSSTSFNNQTSEFERTNIYYYRMFYWSYILVETGYCGVFLMLSIYGIILIYCIKLFKSKNIFYAIIGEIGIPIIALILFMNYYAMSMVKFNFSILVWSIFGIIAKKHYELKEKKYEFDT